MRILPILFNTEMVRAIEEGRKSQTRRVIRDVKDGMEFIDISDQMAITAVDRNGMEYPKDVPGTYATFEYGGEPAFPVFKSAYEVGDILYVRETWNYGTVDSDYKEYSVPECWFEEEDWRNDGKYKFEICRFWYKANAEDEEDMEKLGGRWRPSIHMPKEAARIWLKVTGIDCQRVQDISEEDAQAEGFYKGWSRTDRSSMALTAKQAFMWLWDTTTDPKDNSGKWLFNPWVWVYHFERCEKP